MALPPQPSNRGKDGGGDTALPLQLALSLQHLWRIGAEMGVQWWASAVVYFPRCDVAIALAEQEAEREGERSGMARRAALASRAWRTAHLLNVSKNEGDDAEDEDETGPDLWDRRYNPEHRTFSSGGVEEAGGGATPALPDRTVLANDDGTAKAVPLLFVAEVDELPRAAGVEWHAHLGVAHAGEGSVILRRVGLPVSAGGGEEESWQADVSQVVVAAEAGEEKAVRFVQTVVAEPLGGHGRHGVLQHEAVAKVALKALGKVGAAWEPAVVMRYADAGLLEASGGGGESDGLGPVVPCRSLWDGEARRLAAVTVYNSVFTES
jgi:diphthine-ammonia ligase